MKMLLLCLFVVFSFGANASYKDARELYLSGDVAGSLPLFQAAAEQGDVNAQVFLGLSHLTGTPLVGKKNYDEALRWLLKSSAQGDAAAQYWLAKMYIEALGVERNHSEAARLMKLSADQNYADAQAEYGLMLFYGRGVSRNQPLAIDYWHPAAASGNVDAQFGLGLAYDEAMGTKRDYKQALNWYSKAAKQGDAQAQMNLAIMYQQGNGVIQDYSRAAALYLEAAENGLADAQYSIGLYYHQGRAFERNAVIAHMWLNLASANGQSSAPEARKIVESEMTRQEVLAAQRLAAQCIENNYKNCGEGK